MSKIKSSASLFKTVKVVTSIPEDEAVATILIEDLQVSLGGIKNSGFVNTQTVSLTLALKENTEATQLHQNYRGFIDVEEGVRGLIVIQSAGVTTMVNDFCDYFEGKGGDFLIPIDVSVPAGRDFHSTIYLLIDRDESSDSEPGGLLSIDSLDIAIV